MAVLEVDRLSVTYGRVQAVRSLSIQVDESSINVVLGANGAGKSSFLRATCGATRAAAGSVRWDGQDVTRWPAHRRAKAGIVLVPEGRQVLGPLSVADNLLIGGHLNRSRASRAQALDEIYAMFPILKKRASTKAAMLSGGEQQMLAFGRALMARPRIILMDEPSMGLSPAMVTVTMNAVRDIAKRGIGVLMVEQNAVAALKVATRALVIEQGRGVLSGTADEIAGHPEVVRAFLGDRAVSKDTRTGRANDRGRPATR